MKNKKILSLGIALIMLCLAATVAFAAEPEVTCSTNSITVKSDGAAIKEVELCVIYLDAAGVRRETSLKVTNIPAKPSRGANIGKTVPFNLGKVQGAYSTYCVVE
jgi:type 1 fimbria pilin